MAQPSADRLGVGDDGADHVAEDGAEDGQGEPVRAWQKALAEKARPAIKETWVKAVLPWRIWMRNQWMMAAGVSRQLSHQECPAARQAAWMKSVPSRAARSCRRAERVRNPAMHRGASCVMGL